MCVLYGLVKATSHHAGRIQAHSKTPGFLHSGRLLWKLLVLQTARILLRYYHVVILYKSTYELPEVHFVMCRNVMKEV
jgi:hypothetical protein